MATPYDGYFTVLDASHWQLKSNPTLKLQLGMLSYWQSIGGLPGLPVSNEDYSLQGQHPGHTVSVQRFERAVQHYDPDRVVDNPPTPGPAYLAHVDTAPVPPPTPVLSINGQKQTASSATIAAVLP